MAWMELHARALTLVLVVLVAVGLGAWLYAHMRQVRNATASAQLSTAEQAMGAGNAALAQSDLEKLIKRYPNTRAGREAVLLLAQVLYQKGSYTEGIAKLNELAGSDDRVLASGAESLLGAGYEELKKFAEAADHYRNAANKTPYPTYRDDYLASAARAYTEAGKTDEARKIWEQLATDPSSTVAAEARVRLGQLEVKPAPKG